MQTPMFSKKSLVSGLLAKGQDPDDVLHVLNCLVNLWREQIATYCDLLVVYSLLMN